MARFARDEAAKLRPLPPVRTVCGRARSEPSGRAGLRGGAGHERLLGPWRLIGERVRVLVTAETVRITHAGIEVASHNRSAGRRGRIVERAHFDGVAGAAGRVIRAATEADKDTAATLLRPLAEYEAVAGGAW